MLTRAIYLLLLFMSVNCFSQSASIYSVSSGRTAAGNIINFSSFSDKVILIVNTASANTRADEETKQLKLLANFYKDSGFVIVVYPSNDFNNEPKQNAALSALYNSDSCFIIGERTTVTGAGMSPLYEWLSQQGKNGVASVAVKGDYQKYLISRTGKLVGFFSKNISAGDPVLLRAISAQLH